LTKLGQDHALKPLRALNSKTAKRAYITSSLILLGSLILAGIAVTAYALFYYTYIPTRGFSLPVHLQFSPSHDHHPYGLASISDQLVSAQPYDVRVIINLPRTPANRDAGNFMLDLRLLGPSGTSVLGTASGPEVLAQERRPAILTYYSPVVDHLNKGLELPWYMLGWRHEAETLDVPMMESIQFDKGWRNVPQQLRLEIQSIGRMQVYAARIVFTAKLQGLRYIMYNYRVISFITFTLIFWAVELTFMMLAWFALTTMFSSPTTQPKGEPGETSSHAVKKEEDAEADSGPDYSDSSRTFPTYGRQPPLRYTSPRVKEEEDQEAILASTDVLPLEADDEDEDADFVLDDAGRPSERDSGLGTSMESGTDRRASVRKRRSILFSSGSRDL
ncbi:hypothetical protein K490DRAFT_43655, partial [Saccharata proteae CBS 121410]